ncbi:MAG: hypothetical protein P1P64_09490 [Treponemataceae bacterium]
MKKHVWKFAKVGGVTQLVFKTADDILHLKDLDQKLWTVLAMPTKGIFFDNETASFLDLDGDGFVRPPEILAAIDFLDENLKDVSIIMKGEDSLSVNDIKNTNTLETVEWLLRKLGKTDGIISVSDISAEQDFLQTSELKKITDDDCDELLLKKIIFSFVKENLESTNEEILAQFNTEREAYLQMLENLKSVSYGLTLEQMLNAVSAFEAVEKKINDFFLRCKLLEYSNPENSSLIDYNEVLKNFTNIEISTNTEQLRELPIALPNKENLLDIHEKLNPTWVSEVKTFYANTILPIAGDLLVLTEEKWKNISQKIYDFTAVYKTQAEFKVSKMSKDFLTELANQTDKLQTEIEEILNFEKQKHNIQTLKKLLLFNRDFFTLLKNYVSFSNFYAGEETLFQAGVLFFDTRATTLCFELNADPRHESLDSLSGAYLIYCDITRENKKQKILALLTNGDSDTIFVGRNGLFYDRLGNDWNATITKIVSNPISIREAFFSPYKSLVRLIEEQVAKRASTAEEKSNALVSTVADKTVNAPQEVANVPPKKLDLGTIALIGTAIGGISTLVGSLLQALFGLGFWVPLGLLGLLLLVSGPSMVLAAMKLRKRSIGPILEANSWAINAHAKINIPLGASLTKLAHLPKNSKLAKADPFADKSKGKNITLGILILLLVLAGIFCYFYFFKKAGANPLKWWG